jgi:hypothetical protein
MTPVAKNVIVTQYFAKYPNGSRKQNYFFCVNFDRRLLKKKMATKNFMWAQKLVYFGYFCLIVMSSPLKTNSVKRQKRNAVSM